MAAAVFAPDQQWQEVETHEPGGPAGESPLEAAAGANAAWTAAGQMGSGGEGTIVDPAVSRQTSASQGGLPGRVAVSIYAYAGHAMEEQQQQQAAG